MMHVLGFSPTLYDYFISEQGKTLPKSESQTIYKSVSGSKAPGLKTKNLLEFAKKFYDCPTIQSLPLENDGDSGSMGAHFERSIFFNEVMTASVIKD